MIVLIIEDDPTHLKLATAILLAEGYEVAAACSAEQALQSLANRRPDIILTDLALPDVSGVTLTKWLKASQDTANIPVVAVTAYTDRFPLHKSYVEAGFVGFIAKPIDPGALPGLLAAACGRA